MYGIHLKVNWASLCPFDWSALGTLLMPSWELASINLCQIAHCAKEKHGRWHLQGFDFHGPGCRRWRRCDHANRIKAKAEALEQTSSCTGVREGFMIILSMRTYYVYGKRGLRGVQRQRGPRVTREPSLPARPAKAQRRNPHPDA